MEKTLTIDGRKVRFKSTAAVSRRYKAQFGTDFFGDLFKMLPMLKSFESGLDLDNMNYEALKTINFTVFENVIWVLAKTADTSIPEPLDWYDTFDEFPMMEILPELQDMMMSSFGQTNQKKSNHPAINR